MSTIGIVVWSSVTIISLVFIVVCSHYWWCETFRSVVIVEWIKGRGFVINLPKSGRSSLFKNTANRTIFSCLLRSMYCHIFQQNSLREKVGPKIKRVLFLVPCGFDSGRPFSRIVLCIVLRQICYFCGLLVLFCEQGNEATDSVVRGRQLNVQAVKSI